ncbi:MAG: hypothetical protein HC867_01845 [Bacteroidia bacterium]|nr:hypothetical protein [Bacteroidia bacterium]
MSVTGENEQGLRKIIDLTRFASIFILLLHFYYFCYVTFEQWEIKSTITDRLMKKHFIKRVLFSSFAYIKTFSVRVADDFFVWLTG